ncbi:MAG: LuxR C-terminal-related transcriptional regulator [Candidatus Binatia bacterium]
MSISDETVKTHLKRLYDKLGAAHRAQAVAIALRQNLIE